MDTIFKYKRLCFLYTNQCNFSCSHCITDSSPWNNEKIPFRLAKRCIKDAKKLGISQVSFSGGEPFIFYDEICRLVKLANSLNMNTSITTNGFWANSRKEALGKMKELVTYGLTDISVSFDQFHAQYVPLNNCINIIKAAVKVGIRPRVILTRLKKVQMPAIFKSKRYRGVLQYRIQNIIPHGRAEEFPLSNLRGYRKKENPCLAALTPLIKYDGTVTMCCGPSFWAKRSSLLVLGNLRKRSLVSILNKAEKNPIIAMLIVMGPQGLLSYLKKGFVNKYRNLKRSRYLRCQLCFELLGNDRTVAFLKNRLKLKKETQRAKYCFPFLEQEVHLRNKSRIQQSFFV